MKYLVDIILLCAFLILCKIKKETISQKWSIIFKVIVVSLFLEMTIFNIKSYRLMFDFKNKEKVYLSNQFEDTINNTIYTLNDAGKVKTVFIELPDDAKNVEYWIEYSDSSISYNKLPSKNYFESIDESKYTAVSFTGNVKSLSIIFHDSQPIEKIIINRTIPINISWTRIALMIGVLLIIQSIKYHNFWNEKFSEKSVVQSEILFAIMAISILVCYLFCLNNGSNATDVYTKDFIESLSNYQLSLMEKPDEKILELDNPYDYNEREMLNNSTTGRIYKYDTALFNGKYYVYFGVLPAIILFLPFYLITKTFLVAKYGVFIFAALTMVVCALLIKAIYMKWFKNIPFKLLAGAEAIFIFGIGIFSTITSPRFYEVISMSGLFFAMLGVYFILTLDQHKKIKNMRLFAGCLSLALAVACRPTQLFASILIIPFLINAIKEAKQMDNKGKHKYLFETISNIVVPYLFVAVLLMNYNYARFGNPFDFGEKYQLTLYNVQESGLNFFSCIQGMITALFNLPLFNMEFPFITSHEMHLPAYSYLYVEDISAGLFFLSPICFMLFAIKDFAQKCKKNNKELFIFTINLIAVAFLFLAYTVLKAGMTIRYFLDFGWLLVLAAIIIFFTNYESKQSKDSKKILEKIFIGIACFTIVYNFLQGFNGQAYNRGMQVYNPEVFNKIKSLIVFWQ